MGSSYLGSADAEPLPKADVELAFETLTNLARQTRDESSRNVRRPIYSAISPNTFMYATASGSEGSPDLDIWIVTFDDLSKKELERL